MKSIALAAENLCKTYGAGEMAVHALDNVSFSMHSGVIVALALPININSYFHKVI